MLLEVTVKLHLTYGRADSGCAHTVVIKLAFYLFNLTRGKGRDVFAVNSAYLNVLDTKGTHTLELLGKACGIFVGKCGKYYLSHRSSLEREGVDLLSLTASQGALDSVHNEDGGDEVLIAYG